MVGVIGLVLLALLVAILVSLVRVVRAEPGGFGGRWVVDLARRLSLLAAVILGGLGILRAVSSLAGDSVEITMPVRTPYWPQPGVTNLIGPTARVTDGGFDSADVTVAGLSATARALWGAGLALQAVVVVTVCLLISASCQNLLRGNAFVPLIARMAGVAALVVLFGGLAAQVLQGIAGVMASSQVLTVTGWTAPTVDASAPETNWPFPAHFPPISWWPMGIAILLGAFAALIRYGERLQRDVEGLV